MTYASTAANSSFSAGDCSIYCAIDLDPSLLEGYHVRGQILVRQNRLYDALRAYQSASRHGRMMWRGTHDDPTPRRMIRSSCRS